jgi:hypothetical protein
MGWKNVGKRIVSGAGRAAKSTGRNIERYQDWQTRQNKRSAARKKEQLKKLDMQLKIAKKKAQLKKYKPDPFDFDL